MSTTLMSAGCQMAVAIEIASAKWVVGSFAGGKVRRKVLSAEGPGERLEALLAEIVEALARFGLPAEARVVVGYEAGQGDSGCCVRWSRVGSRRW